MAKFISGRQQQLNVGVSSSTENKTSLQVTGKVGIGTTNADGRSLYVIGDAEVTGVTTATRFSIGPTGSAINITNDRITGPTEIIIDPAGVGVNTGSVRIKGDLFVDGTQTVIDSTIIELKDFQIGIASDVATNSLLDGAGVGIGSTNIRKTLTYDYSSDSLKSSEHFDLAINKTYKINETEVLREGQLTIPNAYVSGLGTIFQLSGTNLTYTNADIDNLYLTAGIVTTLAGTDLTYTNADIDNAYVTTGIVTTLRGTDVTYANAYVTTGIVTTISGTTANYTSGNITTANITTGNIVTGVVTTIRSTDATATNLYGVAGIVTTLAGTDLTYTNADIDNAYVTTGIVTNLSGTNLDYSVARTGSLRVSGLSTFVGVGTFNSNLYVGGNFEVAGTSEFIGVVTFRGGTISIGDSIGDDVVIGGEFASNLVPTTDDTYDLGLYDKQWRNLYVNGIGDIDEIQANIGIVTTISGTTANYTSGNITTANITTGNIVSGVVTTIRSTDATATNLYGVTGVVTTIRSTDATATNLYGVAGIVTTLAGTNLTYTNADIDNAYITSGIATTLAGTDLTYTNADIDNAYITSGIVTTISGSSANYTSAIADTLFGVTGIITTLNGTNLTYTNIRSIGVSTLGLATASQLYVAGVSTFAGITTVTGVSLFSKQLSVSGIGTILGGRLDVKGQYGGRIGLYSTTSGSLGRGGSLVISKNGSWSNDNVVPSSLVDGNSSIFSIDITDNTDSLTGQFFAVRDPYGDIDAYNSAAWCIQPSGTGWEQHQTWFRSSGKVGIGTTNPTAKLEVVGDTRITGILTIGTSTITLDGNQNKINVGSGVTIDSTGVRISGVSSLTATTIYGDFDGELNQPGKTYYVATIGSDLNTGDNINQPYASLVKALSVATSGDIIFIQSGTFTEVFPLTVPEGVSVRGAGIRATFIQPTVGTKQNDGFLLNGDTTIEDLTIGNMFEPGYAFKFAPGKKSTNRSPYVQRVTVLNKGSVTSATDPYGFDTPHTPPTYYKAGRGVLIDGSVVNVTTLEPAMLFNECTFICPNNTALEMTNGGRTEWVNCFTYFADKGIYAHDGNVGLGSTGYVRVKTSGLTGSTPAANDELYYLEANYQSGTYSQVGTALTITRVGHGLTIGDRIFADFTSGTATDGFYLVTGYVGVNTFSVTMAGSATTSGNTLYKEALGFGTVRDYISASGLSSITGKGEGLFELPSTRLGKTVTAFGNAVISTSEEKFGTSSLLLDGTGDYVSISSNSDFNFATGDFALECWVYPTEFTSYRTIFDFRTTTGDTNGIIIGQTDTGTIYFYYNSNYRVGPSGSVTLNAWNHIALTRSGTSTKLFINGTQVGSTYTDTNDYPTRGLIIGADPSGAFPYKGYIDEVRISTGVSRYTANFTPATSAFTSDGNDKLLLHFDGVTGSTSFVDSSIAKQDIRWVRSGVGIATATKITLADYQQFGGDMRSIGSACVFGNSGATADGPGSALRLFAFNFGHVGSGKDFSQDVSLVNQANEVITANNGRVYYASIDQGGDFRVGEAFYVNQEEGTVNFGGQDFTLNSLSDLNVTDGTNTTTITPTTATVGNIVISGNDITSTSGDININPAGISSTRVTGDLTVTGSLNLGYSLLGGLDGDKGDITVSTNFTQWTIDNNAVTFAKMQQISTARVLGRTTAGTGNIEQLNVTGTGSVVFDTAPTISNATLSSPTSTGTLSAASATFSSTLAVTGNTTLNSNVTLVGSNTASTEFFKIQNGSAADKFVVDSSSGNTTISGTLDVTGNFSVKTNVLKIDTTNDRVGVNKTSPAYPLDVTGDINSSTAIKVNGVSILESAAGDATALAIALG